mmetsp:Transcript_67318/g.217351  ORF Transcript_67318/g.217351 Transcript_67318/m.217351 type:complete len:205 (+) Transcript_67318:1390-2004(+)
MAAAGVLHCAANEPVPVVEVGGCLDQRCQRRSEGARLTSHCCLQQRQKPPVRLQQRKLVPLERQHLLRALHGLLLLGRLADAVGRYEVLEDGNSREESELARTRVAACAVQLEEDVEELKLLLWVSREALGNRCKQPLLLGTAPTAPLKELCGGLGHLAGLGLCLQGLGRNLMLVRSLGSLLLQLLCLLRCQHCQAPGLLLASR